MKKILYYFLAFLIPFVVINFIFYIFNASYDSRWNLMVSDLQDQYISLLNYFKNIFSGKESIFYSFSNSLGGGTLSTIAYYLVSPFNFLILLFDVENLYKGVLLIVSLKIALSGLTMYIYLNSKKNNKLYALMFSLCYSLMAYNINFYFNIMWLDAVLLFPLILLGIDKIVNSKASILFGITLFMAVLTNYYMGYMICIFSLFYIVGELYKKYDFKKDKKIIFQIFKRYFITGILACLLTSFLLIPSTIGLTNSYKSPSHIFENVKILQTPLDIFSRTTLASHNYLNVVNIKTVNIYIGIITLILLVFSFLNKNISKKEKIFNLIMLSIFVLSVMFSPLNKIWHGFSSPQGFNYRFSFMFCLYFITIAYKSLFNINEIKLKYFISFFVGYILLCILVIFKNYKYISNYFVILSIVFVFLFLLCLYLKRKEEKFIYLIFLLVFCEMNANAFFTLKKFDFCRVSDYKEYTIDMKKYIDKYDGNYRIEKFPKFNRNDSLLLNYKGINQFLSTANKDSLEFLGKMGLYNSFLLVTYDDWSTEILNSLMGVKYIFGYKGLENYNQIENTSVKYSRIYENVNSLSIGYMVSDKVLDYNPKISLSPYEFQTYIMNLMLNNKEKYYNSVNVKKITDNEYEIVGNDNTIYIYVKTNIYDTDIKKATYFLNNKKSFFEYDENIIKSVNEQNINIKINNKKIKSSAKAYTYNQNVFDDNIVSLKDKQLNIKYMAKNKLKGNIKVLNKGIMFTSIPYEKGWTIKVNNKKVKYTKVFDAFIGLELDKGEHEITFEYYPTGLNIGLIISFIDLFILVFYFKYQLKKVDNKQIS